MQRADEAAQWKRFLKGSAAVDPLNVQVGGVEINLRAPCTVLGGRNGAGKTQQLRAFAEELGDDGLLVDLHYLCEQVLTIIRDEDDRDAQAEELDAMVLSPELLDDVTHIVGRTYSSVEWFGLDIVPEDERLAKRFEWAGEQPSVPYFRVKQGATTYGCHEMGLGEFSVHLLFWILEQYRDKPGLVLLLDEPDAFLPPVGVEALLHRLIRLCIERGWRLIMTTHSEELIRQARDQEVFVLLFRDGAGVTRATLSSADPSAGITLLAAPPKDHLLFVEDESAAALLRALLHEAEPRLLERSTIIWGNGHGYLTDLHATVPRPPTRDVHIAYVLDGDQRGHAAAGSGWPLVFLPTDKDPDELFRTLANESAELALRLGVTEEQLLARLDVLRTVEKHDWVKEMRAAFGSQTALEVLARLWAQKHPNKAKELVRDLLADDKSAPR
jgi:predicted ATPase